MEKSGRTKVHKPTTSKTIKEMFAPASPTGETTKQLEKTLQKHTEMYDKILQAIQDSKVALEAQIGDIQVETGLLRADHKRMTETEATLGSVRPTVINLQAQMKVVQAELQQLKERAEDAEERSRRNNV